MNHQSYRDVSVPSIVLKIGHPSSWKCTYVRGTFFKNDQYQFLLYFIVLFMQSKILSISNTQDNNYEDSPDLEEHL